MVKQGYKQTEIGVIPEDWEVKPFKEVTRLITCGIAATPHYVNESLGKTFLSSTNVKKGKIDYDNVKYIPLKLHNQLYKNNPPEKGDLLYTRVGAVIGEAAVINVDYEFSIYVSLTLIKEKKAILNNYYLMHLLNSTKYENLAYNTVLLGGGVGNLNVNVVREFPIILPPLSEQEAIASALSDVDAWIESLEQLIAKKRLIKQGAMQELLTPPSTLRQAQGSSRAEDAEPVEAWEVKKLGEIVNFKNGAAHENVVDENGEFVIVNSKFISQEGRIRKYSNAFLCPLYKNEIVMVMSDIPNGKALAKCFIIDKDNTYTLNQRICAFEAKEGFDAKYLFYKINRNDYFLAFDSGSGQTNLRRDEVLNCPIYYPSFSEQERIATILSDMDAELESLANQLAKARQIKQGMMQELLTGRTRLV